MTDILYMAWRHLACHRVKTVILVTSLMLITYLPIGLRVLVGQSARELTARAEATPLLVGAKGSPLELVLNTLYFESETPERMRYAELTRVRESDLARAIPLYVRFRSREFPIVGTSIDYLDFRGLRLADGRAMAVLGECVLGATVARSLDAGPGDAVVSSPETAFDLAGVYPLKMKVAGVLAPSHTPDDLAIFVDVKTSWIIQGLGHGHQDLSTPEAASAVLSRDENVIRSNASIVQYNEITEENIDSFHFHGSVAANPLTAIIVLPPDEKSGVILRGRYRSPDDPAQIVQPVEVMDDLLETILTVQSFVVAAILIVSLATLATAALVFLLSLRLRRREVETMMKIGGSRSRVAAILLSEVVVVLAMGIVLAGGLTLVTGLFGSTAIRAFILS